MDNPILGRHQPKNVPLPKTGTAARYVVDQWQQAENGRMRQSDLMGIYLFRLRLKNPRKQSQYASMNLSAILKKYGFKEGKPGDRSPWVFGARFPTPGTFAPAVAPPPPPSVPPPAHAFGVGDMVTCNRIGRSVVAEVVEQTPDKWCKIKWPNGLTDNVPSDLLQLVSPAEKGTSNAPFVGEVERGMYKSEKTKRLERELAESAQADKLKTWAKQAVELMRKEWTPAQMKAICEELETPQYIDPGDEHLYDDEDEG